MAAQYDVFSSAARTVTTTSSEITVTGASELLAFLNVSAASGTTPTLNVKFQQKDLLSGEWFDMSSLTFTQLTAVGKQAMSAASGLVTVVRAVATIAGTTPSFTFSLSLRVG